MTDAIVATKEISIEKGFRQEQQTIVHVGDFPRSSDDALMHVPGGAISPPIEGIQRAVSGARRA